MKAFTFDDYREALETVGPRSREIILERALRDKNIDIPDFVRLCQLVESYWT